MSGFVEKSQLFQELPTVEVRLEKKARRVMKRASVNKHALRSKQPKKTYLTHISHLFGFHSEIQQKLPKNVFVAYDNLEIII